MSNPFLTCPKCKRTFKSANSRATHEQWHDNEYKKNHLKIMALAKSGKAIK